MQMQLIGADSHIRMLDELSKGMRSRIVKQMLEAGEHEILATTRPLVPVGTTGALRDSLRVGRAKSRKGVFKIYLSTSQSENIFTGDQWYGGPVNFGHWVGSRKLGSRRKTFVEGVQFMERGFAAGASKAIAAMAIVLKAEVLNAAAKQAKTAWRQLNRAVKVSGGPVEVGR